MPDHLLLVEDNAGDALSLQSMLDEAPSGPVCDGQCGDPQRGQSSRLATKF